MRKLDFLIAGVQKGGTTALHRFLSAHPQVFMPRTKELHFFDDENIDWSSPDYEPLHEHFAARGDRIAGEATPIYIYWRQSLARIQSYNPDIKLIVLLRNPVERAYSHWQMHAARRVAILPFSEAIREERQHGGEQQRKYSYVERGLYAEQIERAMALFPREQLLFMNTDELRLHHAQALNRICRFLGVPPFAKVPEQTYVTQFNAARVPMSDIDRSYLAELFREDMSRVEKLTGICLGPVEVSNQLEQTVAHWA